MTTTNGKQLAKREYSDDTLKARLETAVAAFGMKNLTPDQLNAIYLLARKYDVDPITDITMFRDRPIFTIDGRIRMMRRHPEYAGYRCVPLTASQKEAWGYKSNEIVVECTIRTRSWGDITARGKVDPAEFDRQPVARSHPQEMAEKRAIVRAARMAFGADVPEDDDLDDVRERLTPTPERVEELSARYEQIYGDEAEVKASAERVLQPDVWGINRVLSEQAAERGIAVATLNNRLPLERVERENERLAGLIRAYDGGQGEPEF